MSRLGIGLGVVALGTAGVAAWLVLSGPASAYAETWRISTDCEVAGGYGWQFDGDHFVHASNCVIVVDAKTGAVTRNIELPEHLRLPTGVSLAPSGEVFVARTEKGEWGVARSQVWKHPAESDEIVELGVFEDAPTVSAKFFWHDAGGTMVGGDSRSGATDGPSGHQTTLLLPLGKDGMPSARPVELWDGLFLGALSLGEDVVVTGETEGRLTMGRFAPDGTEVWRTAWPPLPQTAQPPASPPGEGDMGNAGFASLSRFLMSHANLAKVGDAVCGYWGEIELIGCIAAADGSERWLKSATEEFSCVGDCVFGIGSTGAEVLFVTATEDAARELVHYSASGERLRSVTAVARADEAPSGWVAGFGDGASMFLWNDAPENDLIRLDPVATR